MLTATEEIALVKNLKFRPEDAWLQLLYTYVLLGHKHLLTRLLCVVHESCSVPNISNQAILCKAAVCSLGVSRGSCSGQPSV